MRLWRILTGILLLAALSLAAAWVRADIAVTNKISDVRGTKHNFSAAADGSATPSGGKVPVREIKASSETQVCVFCHTPHQAESITFSSGDVSYGAPLWNRKLSEQGYNSYTSTSMEAANSELDAAPGGSSKLCLSCHDGTMAIDKVNVLNGAQNVTIAMSGKTTPVKMPGDSKTGFTRNLGTDLSSDHPISFTYDATLAGNDGELHAPNGSLVGNRRGNTVKPVLPLENNQMQCATCHDPHLRDKTTSNGNAKFLRLNRFQVTAPAGGAFSQTSDIICLACHEKANKSWAFSAHANSGVATQLYKEAAAKQREFPSSLDVPANTNPPVWQVSCLNCHDTHSVQGARRLLREGSSDGNSPKVGGNSAIEQTCYQCHTNSTDSIVTYTAKSANDVPNILGEFGLTYRMPVDKSTGEVHDIGGVFNDGIDADCSKTSGKCGKDLLESRDKLGRTALANRHAECTDCHNPHRVIKAQNGLPGGLTSSNTTAKAGTHRHENASGYIHANTISGVLRGSWGVEPVYGDSSFHEMPGSFDVKRGDPIDSVSTLASEKYVTREYQICLKCHSNYGYPDDNLYPSGNTRPPLGSTGLTAQNANGHLNFTRYTNQAKEFQPPALHAVPAGSTSRGFEGGAGKKILVNNVETFETATNNNNHRSWHPVMAPTGRTGRAGAFLSPWNNSTDANNIAGTAGRLGVQTMLCSDCHGRATGTATVMPTDNTNTNENGSPWGPHGSDYPFLLKGTWSTSSGEGDGNTLCFKCHSQSSYAGSGGSTGFRDNGSTNRGDLHAYHANKIDTAMKCNFCHVAVPHGWKNRGLLVNLRDVGPEAGQPRGTDVGNGPYTNGPYYRRAYLRISSFPSGTAWQASNCGGKDNMISQCETAT